MAKVIGKVNLNSLNYNIASTAYATCGTAAATAAKVAYIEGTEATDGFTVVTGITVHVRFANTNTAANPTLSVNGSPATAIMKYGTTKVGNSEATSWYAGSVVSFTYDGTYWIMNDRQKEDVDTNQKVKAGSVTFGSSDTVNFISGSNNLTVTGNASDDTITISLTGTLPSTMIPGSVDEIIEGYFNADEGKFYKTKSGTTYSSEITGETGKIYVDLSTNKTYRWSGSAFVEISASLVLGTNEDTAAPGNHKHKIASHTHTVTGASYTPAGSVTVTPNTTTVNSITAVGSLPSLTITEATASKITGWSAGSAPTRSSFTYATGSAKSTATALTGVKVTTQPTVTLTSNDTEVDGSVAYLSSVSVGDPSLSGTTSFNTDAIKDFTLSASDTSTAGPAYVASISGSKPSLTGTKTFVTGYASFSGGSGSLVAYDASSGGNAKTTNGNRIAFITSLAKSGYTPAGTVSLTANTATATGRIKYVEAQGTFTPGTTPPASATFTGTEVTSGGSSAANTGSAGGGTASQATGSAGANTSTTSNTSTAASTAIAEVTDGVLTIKSHSHTYYGPVAHTHTYTKPAAHTHTMAHTHSVTAAGTIAFTAGDAPSMGAATTKYLSAGFSGTNSTAVVTGGTTYYLAHGHTAASLGTASTGTVGIQNGEYTATTKYMAHTNTAASKASISLTAGSLSLTTKYLTATASGTAVGANGTATVIKELNTGTAYSITGVGSVPSLTYDTVTVGSASDWSAGTLPTKGSNTTVVTGIKSASFSGTAATITPTIAGSGELTTGTPQ